MKKYLAAICLLLPAAALGAGTLEPRIKACWDVQERWQKIAEAGSFEYEFDLRLWNGSNVLKGHEHRIARVDHDGGGDHSTILSAERDGKDTTADARREEARREHAKPKEAAPFPSPFDPRFREKYDFHVEPPEAGFDVVSFSPRTSFDNALIGKAFFDADGRPRRVALRLAHPPIFAKNLSFTILLDEDGLPVRCDSSGAISLIVWKRRFESTILVRSASN